VEVEDFHGHEAFFSAIAARQRGQYQGAGVFTGLGLRFLHLAQRYRLPFTAVLGLSRLPVRGMFFGIRFRFQSPPANSPATTSGTPTVAGFATISNPVSPTLSGTSGLTTIRRAFLGASNTSPAAG